MIGLDVNSLESPSLEQFIYRTISTSAPVSQDLSLFRLPFLTLIAYKRCESEDRGAINVGRRELEEWRRRCEI